jgi:hypothetical protein
MPANMSRTVYLPPAAWLGAVVIGLMLVWLGYVAFDKASAFQGRAGHAFTGKRGEKRSIAYAVAQRHHATLGRWGCAAVFVAPGVALVGFGVWDLRRRLRSGIP